MESISAYQTIATRIKAHWLKAWRTRAVIGALGALLLLRLALHVLVYCAGFEAITADDFGRVALAAQWAQHPWSIWSGAWLPLHTYLFGAALRLDWNLLYVPRLIAIGFGLLAIPLMYQLGTTIFKDRTVGIMSALLLTINPAHIWLSSTPLTEGIYTTLILATSLSFVLALQHDKQRYVYLSAGLLAVANGFRFESWMISIVFSGALVGMACWRFRRRGTGSMKVGALLLGAVLPWLFPFAWIVGSYIQTGSPLGFLATIQTYKLTWYGRGGSYTNYLQTFLRIDPYATALVVPAALMSAIRFPKSAAVWWFLGIAIIPLLIFALLHRGQAEPPGNYLRYLAPFLFMFYPLIAALIVTIMKMVSRTPQIQRGLSIVVVAGIVAAQLPRAFDFVNDPATAGLAVGQALRIVRQAGQAAPQNALIELKYWDYLAIHVGANDLSSIIYDRALDLERRQTRSLFLTDPAAARTCISSYNVRYIAATTPEVRQAVEQIIGVGPFEEIGSYWLYRVPRAPNQAAQDNHTTCPLSIAVPYPIR